MMVQTQAIINFNHSVDQNGLRSKHASLLPPFPWAFQQSKDKLALHSPQPQHPFSASNDYARRAILSASPASSASSSASGSLTLEDEEIRRIFSNDPLDSQTAPRSQPSLGWKLARPPWADPITPPSPKDALNPHARVFVPTLEPIPDELTPSLPSPFNLGPGEGTFLHPPPVRLSISPPLTPEYPPGLPHPPLYRHLVGTQIPQSGSSQIPDDPPTADIAEPSSAPAILIQQALNPMISAWYRDLIANRIVTSSTWTVDSVIELAEIVCFEACQSSQDPGAIGQDVPVCPQERYWPITFMNGETLHLPYSESRAQVAALLGQDLSRQLSAWCGEEVTQTFSSCLREKILQTFLHHWDSSIESSINYFPIPTTHRVRSALAVSAATAALYVQDFISHADISMCVNVLLSSLKSAEHAEALANIVLGCGRRFWASTPTVAAHLSQPMTHSMILKRHVGDFLFGLEVNCDIYRLSDDKSVVNRPWGEGRLMARLHEVANNVRAWEVDLQREMHQQTTADTHYAS
ncbi:hypothetical protein D9619_006977 [Psilocybe cf. subviscida]|uniref:Uncharacterized protein n=1 Tax=Psilocybe cf. subviscida TaxID=2480587 RepID=A0A8H5EWS9_9AGAR|nr:hypothetical protein D9619_006977 [Psilocybe cf. subviscida]